MGTDPLKGKSVLGYRKHAVMHTYSGFSAVGMNPSGTTANLGGGTPLCAIPCA